jgi:putative ABC transport system permease protein
VFVGEDPQPMAYTPLEQGYSPAMGLIVRTSGRPEALRGVVEREVRSIDRDISLNNIATAADLLSASLTGPRVAATLLSIFGMVALVLAAVGMYGVMSYSVNLRSQEIGIRMALGARLQDVLKLILAHGMKLVLIGEVVGLAGAFALTRLMRGLLFEVAPTDIMTFVIVAGVLTVVALIACYVPARRASKVDPLEALRCE